MKLIHPEKAKGKKIAVIVGAGFAGLNAAKALSGNSDIHVVLVDQKNHHLFQPLLYQVATAGLNPADIAVPIRAEFAGISNIEVHLGKVDVVNLKNQTVQFTTNDFVLEFDFLILACGAMHSYFGHPEWEEFAPGLKTLEQAAEIRKRIFVAFEDAENEINREKINCDLTFIVVGGGPTGVELAGAIAEISKKVLINDFRRIDSSKAKVILIEAGPRLLPQFSEKLSEKTSEALQELGVDVRTSVRVQNIDEDGVHTEKEFIPSKSIFWAAGVQARNLQIESDVPVERDSSGRIKVTENLSLKKIPNVFVIGDMAHISMSDTKTVPGLAPAAIQQGKYVANVIRAQMQGRSYPDFEYLDKGMMATIGKDRAILEVGHLKLSGHLAWLAWLFIHVFYLVGFKNRLSVFFYWGWNYIFSKRGARIITDRNWKI